MFIDPILKISLEDEPTGASAPAIAGDAPAGDPPAGDPPAGDPPADPKDSTKPLIADDPTDKPADDPAPAIPVEYKFDDIENLSEELAGELGAFAKEAGLTQEQATALAKREAELNTVAQEAVAKQEKAMQDGWRDEARQDEVLNKDGKFDENVATAKRGLDYFFPKLAAQANELPFLDHPEVLRGLYEIGKLVGEDGDLVVASKPPSGTDRVNNFYPSMRTG